MRLLHPGRFVWFAACLCAIFAPPPLLAQGVTQRQQPDWQRAAVRVGSAPPGLPLDRMLLVLRRSPRAEGDLHRLLGEQQTRGSARYHQWLTPSQFGRRFGPTPAELAAVTGWLRQQKFAVGPASAGGGTIEFSGTAERLSAAFHTALGSYQLFGHSYWAADSVPAMPAMLAPVVAGIVSLTNFPRRSAPLLTISNGTAFFHAIVPGDFAKIYDLAPLYSAGIDGSGQSIALAERWKFDSQDLGMIAKFQSLFLPQYAPNPPTLIVNGADPPNDSEGDYLEAALDTEWAGAVAPRAKIVVVASASTDTTDGVDLSAQYIVDHDLAAVMSTSYGSCEQDMGQPAQLFYQQLYEQAAAEGITGVVSAGDSGAAGCDYPSGFGTLASHGLAVNGLASSPYDIAVGGTQINDGTGTDWSQTNASDWSSALGYLPEVAWNESCGLNRSCPSGSSLLAGGGGASTLHAKPPWQSGPGVPADAARDLPDVSLDAAEHDAYVMCGSCYPQPDPPTSDLPFEFTAAAGTSVGAPAFAGVMALVNQAGGGRQGAANARLYQLAAQPGIFHDIVAGSNAVPCAAGSPDCDAATGLTVTAAGSPAYPAGPGYDLATGLGTPDVANLVNAWGKSGDEPSRTQLVLSPATLTHGQTATASIQVAGGAAAPTGEVVVSATPAGGAPLVVGRFGLANGTASGAIKDLPGGSDAIAAQYLGDGNYAGSTSAPVAATVNPEASVAQVSVSELLDDLQYHAGTTVHFGDTLFLKAVVAGASGQGAPGGAVAFSVDGAALSAPVPLDSDAQAGVSQPLKDLPIGTHTFTAAYSGDAGFAPSNAPPVVVNVAKGVSTAAINQAQVQVTPTGRVAYFLAHVDSVSDQTPTGNVQFSDGGGVLGSASVTHVGLDPFVSLPSNVGTRTRVDAHNIPVPAGTDKIVATYLGDSNFAASTSAAFSIDPGGFTIAPTSPQTFGAGPLHYTLQFTLVQPMPVTTVQLSCVNYVNAFTCQLDRNSITLSPDHPTATAVATFGIYSAKAAPLDGWPWWGGGLLLLAAGLALQPRRKLRVCAPMALALGLLACGGASGPPRSTGPPPGNATVRINAVAGTNFATTVLTAVVP